MDDLEMKLMTLALAVLTSCFVLSLIVVGVALFGG